MSNKPSDQSTSNEDFKDHSIKYVLSKHEYDLYTEEDDIKLPVIRVKYFSLPNKGGRWKIFEDNKIVCVIEAAKLNNKEKDFLKTVDGVNFLISQYKAGINSFNSLKNEIKKKLKKPLTSK